MPRRRRRRLGVTVFGVLFVMTGCATGPRPTLGERVNTGGETGVPTGIEAVDRLLGPLEGDVSGPFTATYEITRKLGSLTATATVVREGTGTSVTVGDVRFLTGVGDDPSTCDLPSKQCEPGVHDERISDLSVPSTFWLESPARLLRVATARTTGTPTPYDATIAGLTVHCVEVPVGSGTEKYCVTPTGPIASFDTAATFVNLIAWSAATDPAALQPPS